MNMTKNSIQNVEKTTKKVSYYCLQSRWEHGTPESWIFEDHDSSAKRTQGQNKTEGETKISSKNKRKSILKI